MPTKKMGGGRGNLSAENHGAPSIAELVDDILGELRSLADSRIRDEMGPRYGIYLPNPSRAFGVRMNLMQKLAKSAKGKEAARNHVLALALWDTGWYEARTVAALIDEPTLVTAAQMDRWRRDFDNWAICDTACFKLFDQVEPRLAFGKVEQWGGRRDELAKRAAFALLASLALHRKDVDDAEFLARLPLVDRAAGDERNFVKKSVSWALRSIGARGTKPKAAAAALAKRLAASEDKARRWVGKDVLRQL
jgi:3-methyladenine DNA glycosylase AlkD